MRTKPKVGGGGNAGSVRYDGAQVLTAPQQTQAKTNIGLENVNNTSDANKPTSGPQAASITAAVAGLATSASIPQAVRETLLTGLSLANSADIAAGDSFIVAMGKLQAQLDLPSGAGSMVYLGGQTVAATVSVIDFFDIFTAGYDDYLIQLNGLNTSANVGVNVRAQYASGVSTGNDYVVGLGADASVSTSNVGTLNVAAPGFAVLANSGSVLYDVRFKNVNSGAARKSISIEGCHINSSSVWQRVSKMVPVATASIIKGFRLELSTGTFVAGGTIRIFGIKNN